MRTPKLSPAQVKVLRALAEPGVVGMLVTGIDAHWFLTSLMLNVRFATMDRLINSNFVSPRDVDIGKYSVSVEITPAGREYLADLEGKE